MLTPRLRAVAAGVPALVMLGAIAIPRADHDPFSDSLDALRMLPVLSCVLLLAVPRRGAGAVAARA